MRYYDLEKFSIGHTPLVRIKYKNSNLFLKIEGRNLSGSVKSRLANAMIEDALKTGKLKEGMTILEPTSGNTGIALAQIGASLGFKVALTMPETMSIERRNLIKAFGAKVILTEGSKGMTGSVNEAMKLASESDKYFIPNQFENPINAKVHRMTTGPEIWEDLDGNIDVFVAGIGTGGTFSGVSQYIKIDRQKKIYSIAVEPATSPVITQKLANEEIKSGSHKIQGIGAGFIPKALDLSMIDRVQKITDDEAISHARILAQKYGIFCGFSGGASFCAGLKAIDNSEDKNLNVVVIIPDTGERYLTSILFNS